MERRTYARLCYTKSPHKEVRKVRKEAQKVKGISHVGSYQWRLCWLTWIYEILFKLKRAIYPCQDIWAPIQWKWVNEHARWLWWGPAKRYWVADLKWLRNAHSHLQACSSSCSSSNCLEIYIQSLPLRSQMMMVFPSCFNFLGHLDWHILHTVEGSCHYWPKMWAHSHSHADYQQT